LTIRGSVDQFHTSPILAHFVVSEPVQIVDVNPKMGQNFELGPAKGRIAVVAPGRWISDSDEIFLANSTNDQFSMLATFDHAIHRFAWSMRCVNKAGKETTVARRKYNFDRFRTLPCLTHQLWTAEEKPHLMRFRFSPKFRQLVFRIDSIPGLPAENQNVDNLFDVRIPWIEINSDGHAISVVTDVTQMEWKWGIVFETRPGAFPKSFENTTPRKILDYVRANSNIERIWTDPEDPLKIQHRVPEEKGGWFEGIAQWLSEL
jgi:hypothetical protein